MSIPDPSPDSRILDIYKLAVEMADRISARRAVANAFFLTVNTTLVAVVGLKSIAPESAPLSLIVCVAGVAISVCWWLLLRAYRRLNTAKFEVICRIESEHLPVQPYTDEWEILAPSNASTRRRDRFQKALRELSAVERSVPIIFAILYFVLLAERLNL